jgi:hypothetical protein
LGPCRIPWTFSSSGTPASATVWEHQYGLEIGTLDNPGWRIKVDLVGTSLEGARLDREVTARADDDWLHVWIEDDAFHVACGPLNLAEAMDRFRSEVTSQG